MQADSLHSSAVGCRQRHDDERPVRRPLRRKLPLPPSARPRWMLWTRARRRVTRSTCSRTRVPFCRPWNRCKALAWCGRVTSADGSASWYVIAPGLQGQTFDALCTPYDERLSPAPGRLHRRAVEPRRAGRDQSRPSALRIPRLRALSWTGAAAALRGRAGVPDFEGG